MSDHQAGAGPQQPPQTLNVAGQTVRLQQVLAAAGSRGQQFVITSQVSVPGLTQVIPTIATTSAALQQAGVTRILNIASSPRVNVVGVSQVAGRAGTLQLTASNAANSGSSDSPSRGTVSLVAIGQPAAVNASSHPTLVSSLSSPPRQRTNSGAIGIVQSPPTLVLTPAPNLVRTSSGSFATPLSSASNLVSSPQSSAPSRKRMRLTELQERAPPNEEIGALRKRVLEHKMARMRSVRERYAEHAAELFFLQAGGNMMDYHTWRKRPPTPQFLHFLRANRLDPDDDDEDLTLLLYASSSSGSSQSSQSTEIKIPGVGATPVAISTTLPPAVAQLNQQGHIPGRPQGGRHGMVFGLRPPLPSSCIGTTTATSALLVPGGTPLVLEPSAPSASANLNSMSSGMGRTPGSCMVVNEKGPVAGLSPSKLNKLPLVAPMSRQHTRQHSISAVYDTSIGSQEQIAEKAKQEAYVMQRIAELQREGLWSEKRLPKVQEPPRVKAHWDYLIEEMIWLAADFAQERKWKKAAAKKCARNVQKYFQEKAIQAQKAEKVQELRLKKIASFIAKEVKTFWSNVEKLVEYKQQTRLEEKRKKALDQHLSFIVDQTEKYSTWLAESMNKTGMDSVNPSVPASVNSSRISSPSRQVLSDDEFQPNQSSTDDEETIAKAEEDLGMLEHIEEVEMLKRESELPLEDLLKELPDDYLENRDKVLDSERSEGDEDDVSSRGDDDEFTVASGKDSTDDEETIQEQEAVEGKVDHKKELEVLQAENEMSIEELIAKYGCGGGTEEVEDDVDVSETEVEDEVSGNESYSESENSTDDDGDSIQSNEPEVGLRSLLDDENDDERNTEKKPKDNEAAGKEISDVAALAESIQPKGNTLSSTSVVTKIPFLLKHTLREYQHIGLDWLVTMFDRKLNGILADEMGLGKTIQTISLLAHLACEKGNWGPHLIIVPTSVMLNWEMELKKWCPAFKILTYYGSQKERKQKRTGWTKPNAFHVCITSYKLVIQDHQSFRRKKWKYLILDEAQNIKNFKSQRWQLLLNFQAQRRLLLTGTPLQNNLMELWSLMHFLMPNVFQSHREFKEWFSNPVTGMIEGNSEYNESLIKRLHKVLRPFLLRRLKTEVEKQLPKKYEHIVMCRLSKRQRYLYDDFMSRAKTRETLATGNLLSVINVLMQLRKVCNHPNLFEVRPTISPFQMEGITYETASLVMSALDYDPFKHVDLFSLNLLLVELETCLTAFVAHRIKKYHSPSKLIEEIDSAPEPPPRCPSGKIKIHVRLSSSQQQQNIVTNGSTSVNKGFAVNVTSARVGTSPLIKSSTGQAIPVAALGPTPQQQPQTVTGVQVKQSDGVQRFSVPAGFAQLVQTSTGRHILLTPSTQVIQPLAQNPGTTTVVTASGHRLTVLPKSVTGVATTTVTTVNRMIPSCQTTTSTSVARPVMRVPPLNVSLGTQATSGTLVNTVVAGTTTVTTTTTVTSTKTSTAVTQPVPAAVVQQSQRNSSLHMTSPSVSSSIVTRNETKIAEERKQKQEMQAEAQSVFYLSELEDKKRTRRREKLEMLNRFNVRRCAACPIYGSDLIEAMRIVDMVETRPGDFRGSGFVHCLNALKESRKPDRYWTQTKHLMSLIHAPQHYVNELGDIFSRFVLCVPAVSAPQPRFHVSHPPPSKFWGLKRTQALLQQELSSHSALLHPIASAMVTQFPDPRLIQYDCGKLQVLDRLLRQLKADHHRVLIFTQMTRMLDVLEAFLNFHGHIYLRLDGTTRIDQRQMLMERFNADRRVFCFILSTRSGGIGVNLTGADTVIFYDSDWNPTMDAQAQDRCHRIGQTRDVHIYRLVSEMTVEENILKKANQKRLLGDLAIEGGNFTTAYFKSSTIQDLFNIDVAENDASRRMAEVLDRDNEKRRQKDDTQQLPLSPNEDKAALGALETALAAAEDETDVQAARTAKAEAAADLAEFDETIPLDDGETGGEQEMSKAELEVHNLIQQLTPVERYAMKFMEDTEAVWSAEQLAAAEAEIEQQKREWELGRLQVLKEEADRHTRVADADEQLLTFSHEDAHNQVWVSQNAREQMPMWCPPTPPQDENDVYIDHSMGFLYEQTIMSESQLPVVYVKKEHKRMRVSALPTIEREGRRPMKMRKEESLYAPRSLFDRPSPALAKMRRDMKLQRCRGIVRSPSSLPGLKPPAIAKPMPEPENVPEWVIHEDWTLLQAVQVLLELPLNLMILSPGHTPNWDMVADMVNNVSRIYRSPKQCRNRYDTIIVPREEGKILYDSNPKKQKKTKGMYKLPPQTKMNRPMRTSQLYIQDNNGTYTQLYTQRFETIKAVSNKRTPTVRPQQIENPTMRNPKHAAVLADIGIVYDQPLTPIDVATRRAERIAKEKQKTAQAAAAQVLSVGQAFIAPPLQQQQQHQQQQQQQQVAAPAKSGSSSSVPQVPAPSIPSPGPSAQASVPNSSPQAVVVGLNQATSPQQIGAVVSVAGTTVIQTGTVATLTPALSRVQRPVATLTVQDMVAAAGQVRAVANSPAVVSVANLTSAQVQVAAQRLASANLVSQSPTVVTTVVTKGVTAGTVTAGGKALNHAQLQFYKQQQLLRQQQQRLIRDHQLKVLQAQSASNQKVSVAVTAGTTMGIATVAGVTAVQVSQAQQQRAQFIKQTSPGGKQTAIARTMSETEMAALIKRQQQHLAVQQKAGGTQVAQVQVPTQAGLTPAQILAQAGLQVQQAGTSGQTQVATLVKTVSAPGSAGSTQSVTIPVTGMTLPQVKATGAMKTATPQQIRQLAIQQQLLQHRKLPQQKMTQLTQVGGKAGVQAQLIVQSQKAMPTTMTVQQIQQVIKHVQPQHITHVSAGQAVSQAASGSQMISHAVLTKAPQVSAPGQTLQTRVIPVSSTQQSLKQTIQVVTASPGVRTSVPNVTIDSAGRPQVSVASTLASALAGTIKVAPSVSTAQQHALLTQVNAALQGQPMSVAVRQATQSPVRIQTSASGTPLVAVTVQQPAGVQPQGIPTVVTAQQQHSIANPATQSGSSQEASQ